MGRESIGFKQLLGLLPEGWEAKSKELGALRRAREIKTPEELLRLVLLYLTEGKSMAGTSAITNLSSEGTMSKVAVFKRIQNSGQWLHWLCTNIYRKAGLLLEKPLWLKDRNVVLIDGSKDAKGGDGRQYYMLHYSMDLFTLSAREFLITDKKTGEKLVNFNKLGKNDIVMADRVYGTLAGITHLKEQGADFLLRFRARAFNIYDESGKKIDLMEQFSYLKAEKYGEITGRVEINGGNMPIRICAMRKSAVNEREGLQRLKKERSGILISELQKEYNKYIIVITSLKDVTAKQALDLYRTRWQIELAFKRLKSLFRYNEMPARKTENIKTWFYGQLLLSALCETLVNTGRFSPWREGADNNSCRP